MALTKITAAIIEDGAITASALSDNSIGITQLNVSDGTSGQFLKTDGSGNLSFASVPAGYTDSDVDTKLAAGVGNILTTGYIAGPATFTIDPAAVGDNTGTVVIAGNLQVDGTTTTINSTTMTVDDLNITLASGAANAAAANGAGITVDGASATITYDGTNDEWDFNKDINVTGTITASGNLGIGTTSPSDYLFGDLTVTNGTSAGITLASATNSIGTLAFADGTSGNTAYRGFVQYSHITDGLYFGTSGATALTINNSGNVGIGTDSPATLLHIKADSNLTTDFPLTIENAADSLDLGIGAYGLSNTVGTSQGSDFVYNVGRHHIFQSDGSEKVRFDTSGNVGIGTTSPLQKLVVSDGGGYGFEFAPNNSSVNQILSYDRSGGAYRDFKISANEIRLGYGQAGANEAMRIDSSGNVGIGTTSPNAPLEINGGTSMTGGWGRSLLLRHNFPVMVFQSEYSTDAYGAIGYDNTTGMQFMVNSPNIDTFSSSQTPAMIILDNKNVGIGAVTPAYKLDVNGNIGVGNTSTAQSILQMLANPTNGANTIHFGDSSNSSDPASYAGYIQYAHASNSLQFGTSSSEKMRIASSGNIHINKTDINQSTTLGFDLYANGTVLSTHTVSNNESWILNNYNGSGSSRFDFRWNNSSRGGIVVTSSATSFATSSDYRLKENVDYTWDATTRLKQLKPVRFNWIADDTNTLVDGFLAHEVTSVVPNAVTGTKDEMYDSEHDLAGEEKHQSVDHSKLVPLLVKTIQELEARITTLEG
jgi:hypothetical protein